MIFVTLGSQNKSFARPLVALEKLKEEGLLEDEIIVQAGFTKFESKYMEVLEQIEYTKFNDYLNRADIIITHGGVGNILSSLKLSKKVIAIARLAKYKEHINDHQLQIIEKLSKSGHIIECNDENMFLEKIKIARDFIPNKFIENTKHFNECFLEEIKKIVEF